MKTLSTLCLAILLGCATVATVFADVLPKEVSQVKEIFDKHGATSCSQAMAETINFLVNGRVFTFNALWSNQNTNKNPISVDFLISGTKNDYSYTGSIVLLPVGDKCVGAYVYSFVEPTHNCKNYMRKIEFDGSVKNLNSAYYLNGDGGSAYFMTVMDNSSLHFIFNDVAGGCSVTKREMLNIDAKK